MAETWSPIVVDPRDVLDVGVTPGRLMVWALEKRNAGQHEAALRLLSAAQALITAEAQRARRPRKKATR